MYNLNRAQVQDSGIKMRPMVLAEQFNAEKNIHGWITMEPDGKKGPAPAMTITHVGTLMKRYALS